jgi:hypothetical protein
MKHLAILLLLPLTSLAEPRLDTAVIRIAKSSITPSGEIVSIDGNRPPDRPTSVIYMAGPRTIEYRCPGTKTGSAPASMQLELKGGMVYELVCHGAKATVRVSAQAWP